MPNDDGGLSSPTNQNDTGIDQSNELAELDLPHADEALEKEQAEGKETEEKSEESDESEKVKPNWKRELRRNYREAQKKIRELERKTQEKSEPPKEEAEQKAEEYLTNLIAKVLGQRESERTLKEDEAVEAFEEKLDDVLELNPDFSEDQILEVCEKLLIEPSAAVTILKEYEKRNSGKSLKPRLPKPTSASPAITDMPEKKEDADKHKSIWDIAKDIKKSLAE